MSKYLFFLALTGIILSSCVQNKKLVYLQHGDELEGSVKYDTVLRNYDLAEYTYKIQPEDILKVKVESLTNSDFDIFKKQEDNIGTANLDNIRLNGYLVDRQGYIEFAHLGKIKAAGLSLSELEEELQNIAKNYLESPIVKVRLLNFRLTVLGEVNREGIVSSINTRVTMMEAIGLAGGFTDLANREKVKLIRQEGGQSKVLFINLLEENYMSSSNFFVHQNDILIVPPLKQRPFRKYFGPNVGLVLSSISTLLLIINLVSN